MTEWGVFGVITAVITLGVCVGTPLLKLNSSLTKLTVLIELLQKQFAEFQKFNEKEHEALWDKCEQHDATLNDHETRITVMEKR